MEGDKLALELLHEIKMQGKRYFILFIITLVLLFASNLVWLYAWCMPTEESTNSYDVSSDGDSNAIYNEDGEVSVNDGKN